MSEVRAAWRLGVATCLAAFLTSALFVAPLLASQPDFAHAHPDGAAPHPHDLRAVLVSGPLPSGVGGLEPPQSPPSLRVSPAPAQPLPSAPPRRFGSRAPPA